MLVDIHVHTLPYSRCSLLRRRELLPLALSAGVEAVIVTDHARLWEEDELRSLAAEFRSRGLLLLNGAELASEAGHVLVYGAAELPESLDPLAIVGSVHRQGGVAVLAHPFRHGALQETSPPELADLFDLFDGVEVLNGNLTSEELARGLAAQHHLGLTALGGSDTHAPEMLGRFLTETPPLRDIGDFCQAVREGLVRPVVNPRLERAPSVPAACGR
jgi:predicted metal-dependent phosphoesterase TrpH